MSRRFFSSPHLIAAAVFLTVTVLPHIALADDAAAPPFYDGRLEGYGVAHATLDAGSEIFLWFVVAIFAFLGLAVLFKSANRGHLD